MTAPTMRIRPDVARFVSAVREHLADLPADVVDDLTGGLEADLADLAAESDDPLESRIGSPSAYADELRAAADLPPRSSTGGWAGATRLRWRRGLERLRQQSWWPGVRDFVVALRPAWWVTRAVVAWWLIRLVVPGPLHLVLGVVGVIVSVELGRGRWHGRALAVLVALGNVFAVLCLIAVVFGGLGVRSPAPVRGPVWSGPPGLSHDGQPVTNVFPYDAQGHLLTGVQLFDQNGEPLAVEPDFTGGDVTRYEDGSAVREEAVPSIDAYGQQVWNAFPLSTIERRYAMEGSSPTALVAPTLVRPKALTVPPLAATDPAASEPTASGPAATDGATTAPTSPSATATATTR